MAIRKRVSAARKNQGLVLVMVTAAMLALLGIAALAIDVNHALLNKTRLQNGVDAAALAAAIVLDDGGSTAEATSAINTTLTNMASASGNSEMDFSTANLSVQYSNDPQIFPYAGYTTTRDSYVRVQVTGFALKDFFASIFNVDKNISASAVAGPSSAIQILVNVVPIAVCEGDAPGANGYNQGEVYALKLADQNQSEMGAGNYQLLDFGSGADTVREALAGGYEGTIDITEPVITKPGNTVGPVGQGLNTRFDEYGGGGVNSTDYPPDVYVKEPVVKASLDNDGDVKYLDTSGSGNNPWGYSDYQAALPDCTGDSDCRISQGGQPNRRILPIPIVDCTGATGGTSSFNISAIGCFFMLQKAPTSNSGKQAVFGEFIEDCTVTGGAPGDNSDTDGAYRIVLYKDPLGKES
ncbi:pilus assembly protein TadG-related protein [Vibrio sp. NTOU-M3]|uniref:pilus assembly protein TadG-related protein n=1 Tax=Vibrio sp. NTOU-M3 TaxID=3234954 RepID=UPI0035A8944B